MSTITKPAPLPRFTKWPAPVRQVRHWDNIKPVEPGIASDVLEQFIGSQQVKLTGQRCRFRDIEELTPRGIAVLALFAAGCSVTTICSRLSIPRQDIIRALKLAGQLYGLSGRALRELGEHLETPGAILDHFSRLRPASA